MLISICIVKSLSDSLQYICAFVCVCEWKTQVSAALYLLDHDSQTPRVWTACGAQVPPTAHKHSCCCLPRWQWSGRLQPAGSHTVLLAESKLFHSS